MTPEEQDLLLDKEASLSDEFDWDAEEEVDDEEEEHEDALEGIKVEAEAGGEYIPF